MADPNQAPLAASGLHCGDCRSPIFEAVSVPDGEDYYCPHCAQPVPGPIACGACGSTICPECGSPVERADELGIG